MLAAAERAAFAEPVHEGEHHAGHKEGQVDDDQPLQIAFVHRADGHEGFEQVNDRDGDDRGHQLQFNVRKIDAAEKVRGEARGKVRDKLERVSDMLAAAFPKA